VIIFADLFDRSRSILDADSKVLCTGRVSTRENEKPKLIANEISALDGLFEHRSATLELFLNGNTTPKSLEDIQLILRDHPGKVAVRLSVVSKDQLFVLTPKNTRVLPNLELIEKLSKLLGKENVGFRKSQ
jgi:DNA polymerase III alpha subunit